MFENLLRKFGYHKQKSTHILTDEDRARAEDTRILKQQIRNLEQQAEIKLRMERVSEIFNPRMKPEDMLMQLIMTKLATPPVQQGTAAPREEFSDDEIKKFLDENKPYVAIAKKLSDAEIEAHIRKVSPTISTNSVNRAISMIRGQ